jgi:hypothetical protein
MFFTFQQPWFLSSASTKKPWFREIMAVYFFTSQPKNPMHATFFLFVAYIPCDAKNERKELTMRFRTKVAILLVAVFLSLVGFNMIATSPAFDLLRVEKTTGDAISPNHLAKQEATSHYSTSS